MLLRIQRNGKELLGTRITHFELLHMLGLHDRHGVCCTGRGGGGNGARGWFGSRFSARLHSQTWGAAFPLALGAATDFFGGTKSLGIHFSSHISRVKYSFPSNTWPKPQTPRALFAHTTSTLEKHGSDGVPGGGGLCKGGDFARGGEGT